METIGKPLTLEPKVLVNFFRRWKSQLAATEDSLGFGVLMGLGFTVCALGLGLWGSSLQSTPVCTYLQSPFQVSVWFNEFHI